MAHIAFVAPGAFGHINPTLPIVRELTTRGHRVTYATDAIMADTVRAAGAEPVTYRLKPVEPLVLDGMEAAARGTLALLEEVEQALPQIENAYEDDRPDVIVNDWLGWSGALLAAKWGVPRVQSWSAHAASEGYDFGAFIVGMFQAAPAVKAEFDALLAALIRRHDLPPVELHDFYRPAACNLVYQPRAFHVRNETFDDRYAFVGPTRLTESADFTSPGSPLVLVSLGTIIQEPEFFRTCLSAFAGQPYHVILSVGTGIDPRDLGPLPVNVEAHQRVPQPAVLAHADAFVTHTGMNSTMEALGSAVPMVAIPHTPEQHTTAERIADLGLGTVLTPDAVTADALRTAVDDLLANAATRQRVHAMQQEVLTAGGAPRAADAVEGQLPTV